MSPPIRILVADNWGQPIHPAVAAMYPHITWTVHTEVPSDHPHGHMVAECIARALPRDREYEIVLYPHLLLQGQDPEGWVRVIQEARAEGRPFGYANCSFGAWDGDDWIAATIMYDLWTNPARLKRYRDMIGDTYVVFAAGNEDRKTWWGGPDLDNDVNYPQRILARFPNVWVVGACDSGGVMEEWSSDGLEVCVAYWGGRVPVLNPLTGLVEFADGTSFASPHCCGDLVAEFGPKTITNVDVLAYTLEHATVPAGWVKGERHPKFGLGVMNQALRRRFDGRGLYREMLPASAKPAWMEFKQVAA